jgi:hypothetical protein
VNNEQFIASLVSSMAWPVAVVVAVVVFRHRIERALHRLLTGRVLQSLKAGPSGLEMVFRHESWR